MKRILIINFDEINFHSTLNAISHLRGQDIKNIIELITIDDLETTELYSGLDKVHKINTSKIKKLFKGRVFTDAHTLNFLYRSLKPVMDNSWDEIYTISKCDLSLSIQGLICCYQKLSINNSNPWTVYQSHVAPYLDDFPYNQRSIIASELKFEVKNDLTVQVNQDFQSLANDNFRRIRKRINTSRVDKKIIGIQFMGKYSTSIEDHELISLVNELQNSKEFYPLLIINKTEEEKDVVEFFNSSFSQKVITIDSELCALPAVLSNLDAMISVNPITIQLCDLTDTPSIYVSNKEDVIKYSSTLSNSLSIDRSSGGSGFSLALVKLTRFLTGIDYQLIESDYNCFITKGSSNRIENVQVSGIMNYEKHLNSSITYNYISRTSVNDEEIQTAQLFDQKIFDHWFNLQKNCITDLSRELLASIRHLRAIRDSKHNYKRFVMSLENLLTFGDRESIAQSAILIFKYKLDSLSEQDVTKNLDKVENYLFDLKNDIKSINGNLERFNSITDVIETGVEITN